MSFAVPLFLLAALAGIIPILLHMIHRQQAPVMMFSTLRFLQVAVEKTRRRKYLHDVVLLALRVAALVALALALSRPVVSHLRHLFGPQSAAVVIVLDNSASMATKDQPGRRWDAAVKAVEQILDQMRDGDQVALLVTGGPPLPEGERLLANHEVLRQSLGVVQPSFQRADLAARLNDARKLLAAAPSANREIYVVTDMQTTSWEGLPKTPADKPDRSSPPVLVVDVHGASLPNAGLKSVSLDAAAPVVGVPWNAKVTLVGDASVRQQRHLELHLDGTVRQTSPTVTLEAGANGEYAFTFEVNEPGVHRGEIRIVGDDASSADDRLAFALTVDSHIPVAIVKPQSSEIAYLDDAFYLQRALTPMADGGWAVRSTSLTPSALAAEPLNGYAVIFGVNLVPPDSAAAQRLVAYVRDGGHVVWVAGENTRPDSYNAANQLLRGELFGVPLQRVRERSSERPEGWRITSLDDAHPVTRPFLEPASLYQSINVLKHVTFATEGVSDLRILARLDDGEPLLVERQIGKGSVLFWGSSVHVDWSNFPLRPLFLPLLARLTFHLAGSHAAQPVQTAGTPILVPIAAGAQPPGAEITAPGGEVFRLQKAAKTDAFVRYADTYAPGVYRVAPLDPQQGHPYGVAVNLDPEEASTGFVSDDSLRKRLADQELVFAASAADVFGAIQRLRQGESLMELFLLIVLVALVAETYVANRAGSGGQRAGG